MQDVIGSTGYAGKAKPLADMTKAIARGIRTLALNVTNADSIAAAAAALAQETGRLDMLVNNAGYGLFGAAVDLSTDELRRQFDTNVIAPIQVARAFLPLMLPQRRGRIVNVGSVSGILTTPFAGTYCSSKAALHALSNAMRMELAPFGIEVIMIQPGAVASNIGETGTSNAALPAGSIFTPLAENIRGRAVASQKGAMPARDFARQVVTAVLADTAPVIVRGGPHSLRLRLRLRLRLPFLESWLPKRMLDRKLSKMFGLDQLGRVVMPSFT